ncbi:hypothetical protein MJH12_00800 [bacterium]|nr:hypothetical protein [bacterium]
MKVPKLLFVLFFLSLSAMHATTLKALSLKELCSHAQIIVIASFSSLQSTFKKQSVYSTYQLQVNQYLKGSGSSSLQIHQRGGRHGDFQTFVSGVRHYQVNDQVLLFLISKQDQSFETLGFAQGSFLLKEDQVQLDQYHFFVDHKNLKKLSLKGPEYHWHQQLIQNKHLSYLKELIALYVS